MTAALAPSRRLPPARRLGAPPSNATLVSRSDLSPAMATFTVRPDAGVAQFAPGQYFALGLAVDGRLLQRPYSAASDAAAEELEFAIRLVADGALTPRLWQLRPGDRLRVGPAKGLFRLTDEDPRTHLLLATGTGIAPLVAMARALGARPEPPRAVVVHGVARSDELVFQSQLSAWARSPGACYAPSISRPTDPPNATWRGRVGRIDAILPALIAELGIDPGKSVAYLCGNPAMIEGLRALLLVLGVGPTAIRTEAY